MFTGIVTDVGEVAEVAPRESGLRAAIRTGYDLSSVDLGASIACGGVCLTVTDLEPETRRFWVDVSRETLEKTTLGGWSTGQRVNLERSLRVGDELGGHIVSGHVDGVGAVAEIDASMGDWLVRIDAPRALANFVAPKGSIAVDGCSLTVNAVEDLTEACRFSVMIIPHTLSATSFEDLGVGAPVNLEVDMLARYVARLREIG